MRPLVAHCHLGLGKPYRSTGKIRVAQDHLSFPELLPDYEPHKVREVYLIQWEQARLTIDITNTMDLKLEAIRCHASQVGDFKAFEVRMRRPRPYRRIFNQLARPETENPANASSFQLPIIVPASRGSWHSWSGHAVRRPFGPPRRPSQGP